MNNVCRICRNGEQEDNPLKTPCLCTGSIKYVHSDCLVQWINHSKSETCHICKTKFRIRKTRTTLSFLQISRLFLVSAVNVTSIVLALLWIVFVTPFLTHYSLVTLGLASSVLKINFTTRQIEWKQVENREISLFTDFVLGMFETLGIVIFVMLLKGLDETVNEYLHVLERRLEIPNENLNQMPLPIQEPRVVPQEAAVEQNWELEAVRELPAILDNHDDNNGIIAFQRELELDNHENLPLVPVAPDLQFDEPDDAFPIHLNNGDNLMADIKEYLFVIIGIPFIISALSFAIASIAIKMPMKVGQYLLRKSESPVDFYDILACILVAYISFLAVLVSLYVSSPFIRRKYRRSASFLYLSFKLVFVFGLELIIFPLAIGFGIRQFA